MRYAIATLIVVASFIAGRLDFGRNDDYPIESLLEDYVMDVVDETEFWSVCDSTAFNMYKENTTEWYFAVCMEYARTQNQQQ